MNLPLIALAIYVVLATGLVAYTGTIATKYLVKANIELKAAYNKADHQIVKRLEIILQQANLRQNETQIELLETFQALDSQRAIADARIVEAIESLIQDSIVARDSHIATHATIVETVDKIQSTHADLHAIVETNLRELRGRHAGGSTSQDTCGACGKLVTSWFINGHGQSICKNCKPEGYADALRRGTAKVGV